MSSINFIKQLLQKLTIGNLRSIHLNALPGRYATRLDVTDLDIIKSNVADSFIEKLLTIPEFEFEITFNEVDFNSISEEETVKYGVLSKRLNNICYEENDNYLEHGIKTFGFGFPILVKRSKKEPGKVVKAPLLIWSLDIEKSKKKANTWIIKRNENNAIVLNELLLSYIESDEGIALAKLSDEFLEDSVIDRNEISIICEEIIKQINVASENKINFANHLNQPIQQLGNKESLEIKATAIPYIAFSGIFGLYRSQKESIIKDIKELLNQFNNHQFDKLKFETYQTTTISAVPTDPTQENLINDISGSVKKIIQGPPGTGKSQSLTALITNALENGAKCLIVCEKKTALDVIEQNLQKIGLGELCTIIEDVNRDREKVVQSVRNRQITHTYFQNQNDYESRKIQYHKVQKKINSEHRLLDQKILGDKNWTSLVAEFLQKDKVMSKNILNNKFTPSNLQFTLDEYNKYSSICANFFNYYQDLNQNPFVSPLGLISSSVFRDSNPAELENKISYQLDKLIISLNSLKNDITQIDYDYRLALKSHFNSHFNELKTISNNINSRINENLVKYGDTFHKPYSNVTKFFALFSTKAKNTINEQNAINSEYQKLIKLYNNYGYFKHDFPIVVDNFQFLLSGMNLLDRALLSWISEIDTVIENHSKELNSINLHREIQFVGKVKNLEDAINKLITEFNQTGILEYPLTIESSTLNDKQRELQAINDNIASIISLLSTFRDFYHWKYNYLQLSQEQQNLIKILVEINPSEWKIAFQSWYLYKLLANKENINLPKNGDTIDSFTSTSETLKNLQKESILTQWRKKQNTSVQKLGIGNGKGINNLYNLRGSKGQKRNSLRKIIEVDLSLFTDYFPVLLVNPMICSSLLPFKEGLFDVVIFDEASQLRIEDTYAALLRGKYKIVSGDTHQMPPPSQFGKEPLLSSTSQSNDEDNEDEFDNLADANSLLDYAEREGFTKYYLDIHYRSHHPYLIDFSNAAFYGSRLIPMPPKQDYKPIKFIEVNGIYNNDEGINEDEANKVIDILINDIKLNQDGSLPSVGIATFNLHQRNLILDKISKLLQLNNETSQKILELQAKGLFIKNLENIQGDERDIIIISTTFGKRKKDNTFTQNFGPITKKNGYKLLNVIITRAKYEVFVCTSIPTEYYSRYQEFLGAKKENTGNPIFYAYLSYAKSIETGNLKEREHILELLKSNSIGGKQNINYDIAYGAESPFEEEVIQRLSQQIDPARLEMQHKCGGFRIDIVVKSKLTNKPLIAIECDGAKYHSSNEAYAWDVFRQKHLEEYGFIFHRIWSTNWWINPDKELNRLVDFIDKIDRGEGTEIKSNIVDFRQPEKIDKFSKNNIENHSSELSSYFNESSIIKELEVKVDNPSTEDKKADAEIKKEEIITDKICSKCGSFMALKTGRYGKFYACKAFPKCKNTMSYEEEDKAEAVSKPKEELEASDERCELCGGQMLIRKGKYGPFLGCSNYPDCKNMKPIKRM